jgi:hypothetical protein
VNITETPDDTPLSPAAEARVAMVPERQRAKLRTFLRAYGGTQTGRLPSEAPNPTAPPGAIQEST